MQQICKKSSSMKRMVYLVACLPFWLTSCEEKVTALHFNEAEQVFEIGKESELRFLNETFEIKDKNMEAQTLLTDAGKEIPADEVRIKLVKDIKYSFGALFNDHPYSVEGNGMSVPSNSLTGNLIGVHSPLISMSVCLKKWVVKKKLWSRI